MSFKQNLRPHVSICGFVCFKTNDKVQFERGLTAIWSRSKEYVPFSSVIRITCVQKSYTELATGVDLFTSPYFKRFDNEAARINTSQ